MDLSSAAATSALGASAIASTRSTSRRDGQPRTATSNASTASCAMNASTSTICATSRLARTHRALARTLQLEQSALRPDLPHASAVRRTVGRGCHAHCRARQSGTGSARFTAAAKKLHFCASPSPVKSEDEICAILTPLLSLTAGQLHEARCRGFARISVKKRKKSKRPGPPLAYLV